MPRASRPYIPDYGLPTNLDTLLPWSHAEERLTAATSYWMSTASRAGAPHAVPVQGAWIDSKLYMGGSPEVLWARNLAVNPVAVAHIGNGEEVVIVKGSVGQATDAESPEVEAVVDAYEAKYGYRHPPPFWRLTPAVAFAWTDFTKDATRWVFEP